MVRTADPAQVMALVVEHMDGELVRGLRDCCTQPCRIFGALFGIDPLGPVTYRTTWQAWRFVRARRGPEECAAGIAKRAGLVDAKPFAGAIGRLSVPGQELELTLGICVDGAQWAVKAQQGFILLNDFEQAWGRPWD